MNYGILYRKRLIKLCHIDTLVKAGAYGIQGAFGVYISGISGDYNNVVGLPIARLYHELKRLNLLNGKPAE